ncbi:MAG: tRNA uridine-5-carboxymethylaminomethyl(34) synthesis enzyme MnmG, partial [Lacipirellulaceae bacterium]
RRLTPLAAELGLVSSERNQQLEEKVAEIQHATALLESTRHDGAPLAKYLRRPDVDWKEIVALLPELGSLSQQVSTQVLHDVKYAGYIARQQVEIDRQARLSEKRIPGSFDYQKLPQLRAEAKEKLSRIQPADLSQASRISGVTPADIALLMVYLDR